MIEIVEVTCEECNGKGQIYHNWAANPYPTWGGRPDNLPPPVATYGGGGISTCNTCHGIGKISVVHYINTDRAQIAAFGGGDDGRRNSQSSVRNGRQRKSPHNLATN